MVENRRDMDPPEENSAQLADPNEESYTWHSSSNFGLKIASAVLAGVAALGLTYGWVQHRAAKELGANQKEMSAMLEQSRSQVDSLAARLTAVQAEAEAARTAADSAKNQVAPPAEKSVPHHATRHAAVRRQPVEDPRWQQIQRQLGDQQQELTENQKALEQTQANLDQARTDLEGKIASARTDLGTDIARNHDELVALEKKGERSFFEFDFQKSKEFHHVGPVSISLRKANTKHDYCDLEMLVNDEELSRKHINLYEAVMFYPQGYPLPLEVVINHIGKDSVHGYVSEPKYGPAQQAAGQGTPATTASAAPPDAAATPKLEHRPEEGH